MRGLRALHHAAKVLDIEKDFAIILSPLTPSLRATVKLSKRKNAQEFIARSNCVRFSFTK